MNARNERICVLGLGYIGLPTACLLAARGFRVLGVDVKSEVVEAIAKGKTDIREPDLDVLVQSAMRSERMRVSVEAGPADVFIICVPTPVRDDRKPDVSCIESAIAMIAPHLAAGNLVVLESTAPVGTTEAATARLAELRPDLTWPEAGFAGEAAPGQVFVAYCPERVLPGNILVELIDNDRVVGGIDRASTERVLAFYRSFVMGQVLATNARTAEMCKLAENAFRDVNIAYANELSLVCDRLGVDVWELIRLANCHPRVSILRPGPGVGGHCIAVDPWFIVDSAPQEAHLVRAAREVNDGKPLHVAAKVREAVAGKARPVIACLGLSFKANVDDLRGSPAVQIVRMLADGGLGTILAVEPNVRGLPPALAGLAVELVDLPAAIERADAIAVLVHHREFRGVRQEDLPEKIVVDPCGPWE